jgi:hypothetical protein
MMRKQPTFDAQLFRAYGQVERLLNLHVEELSDRDVEAFANLHADLVKYYRDEKERRGHLRGECNCEPEGN